jgi:hypothetical protein
MIARLLIHKDRMSLEAPIIYVLTIVTFNLNALHSKRDRELGNHQNPKYAHSVAEELVYLIGKKQDMRAYI